MEVWGAIWFFQSACGYGSCTLIMPPLHSPGNNGSRERRKESRVQETPLQMQQRLRNHLPSLYKGKREVWDGVHFLEVTSLLFIHDARLFLFLFPFYFPCIWLKGRCGSRWQFYVHATMRGWNFSQVLMSVPDVTKTFILDFDAGLGI